MFLQHRAGGGGILSAVSTPWRSPAVRDTREAGLDARTLAGRIVDRLADRQAEEIVLLAIGEIASFADYFVIASVTSTRQFEALAQAVEDTSGPRPPRREGTADSGWQLFDFGDVIVHLFGREERAYYDLEGLWSEGKQLLRIE